MPLHPIFETICENFNRTPRDVPTIGLLTHWQAGRAYVMRVGHCHNEEDYMPPLEQFCLRACKGNHKQAEDLLFCIVHDIEPKENTA